VVFDGDLKNETGRFLGTKIHHFWPLEVAKVAQDATASHMSSALPKNEISPVSRQSAPHGCQAVASFNVWQPPRGQKILDRKKRRKRSGLFLIFYRMPFILSKFKDNIYDRKSPVLRVDF